MVNNWRQEGMGMSLIISQLLLFSELLWQHVWLCHSCSTGCTYHWFPLPCSLTRQITPWVTTIVYYIQPVQQLSYAHIKHSFLIPSNTMWNHFDCYRSCSTNVLYIVSVYAHIGMHFHLLINGPWARNSHHASISWDEASQRTKLGIFRNYFCFSDWSRMYNDWLILKYSWCLYCNYSKTGGTVTDFHSF